MGIRLLVCGGRDFNDAEFIQTKLDQLVIDRGPVDMVMTGAAKGADREGLLWAHFRGIPRLAFPADWQKYGKAAGPKRNQQMINEGSPDLVVAFPGSRGTADMVARAKKAGIEVIKVEP